ncbi:MAG: cyclic pyranopterin monophosphate synthase MoaC [Spirochaetaceae bacterium]|jgi:cyclic pyranopterin phosphate synthase|nr:cyclic pyranopterin monophosphate synthase MoaC [Spirochaetaceae bacterium]
MADETGSLNHFDAGGGAVMVDVGDKTVTAREAVAEGTIRCSRETLALIAGGGARGGAKNVSKKGDVLGVARIAGIMAVKKTADLIPLCHVLPIDFCGVDFTVDPDKSAVKAVCSVRLRGKTGAEMEALTGVTVALLTIYDMCKAVDRSMTMEAIHLVEKSGGKSGHFVRENTAPPA